MLRRSDPRAKALANKLVIAPPFNDTVIMKLRRAYRMLRASNSVVSDAAAGRFLKV
jgi:hypothetical protein